MLQNQRSNPFVATSHRVITVVIVRNNRRCTKLHKFIHFPVRCSLFSNSFLKKKKKKRVTRSRTVPIASPSTGTRSVNTIPPRDDTRCAGVTRSRSFFFFLLFFIPHFLLFFFLFSFSNSSLEKTLSISSGDFFFLVSPLSFSALSVPLSPLAPWFGVAAEYFSDARRATALLFCRAGQSSSSLRGRLYRWKHTHFRRRILYI